MARDVDRWMVSDAVRLQKTWRYEQNFGKHISLITDFDERLRIRYGVSGQIVEATYYHWDGNTGEVVCREEITKGKRERVLHLINAARVMEAS